MRSRRAFLSREGWVVFSVVAAGLATAALLSLSYYSTHLMTARYGPWVSAALRIKEEARASHLGLAETLLGGEYGDRAAVVERLERASALALALVEGGSRDGEPLAALDQPELRLAARDIHRRLTDLRGLGEGLAPPGVRDPAAEAGYHRAYTSLLARTDGLQGALEARMGVERERFHRTQALLLVLVVTATLTAAWLVRRDQRAWRTQAGALGDARREAGESRARYLQSMEETPLLVCSFRPDGRITYANRACGEYVGAAPDDLLGRSFLDLLPRGARDAVRAGLAGTRREAPTWSHEHRLVSADGRVRWQRWTHHARFEAGEAPVGFHAYGEDVTAAREAQDEERFRLAFQRLATTISARLLGSGQEEFDALVESALRQLGELFGVDRAYLFLFSADRRTIDNTHEWCAPGVEAEIATNQGLRCADFAYVLGRINRFQVVQVPDVAALPEAHARERDEFLRQGIRSLIALPVVGPQRVLWGLLGFDAVRRPFTWPEEQVDMLRILADVLGAALSRRQVVAALRESSDRYRAVVDSARDGYLVVDAEGRVVEVNDAYCRMSGYSRAELLAQTVHDLEARQEAAETERRMAEIAAAGSALFESRHRRRDGSSWPVEVSVSHAAVEGGCYFAFVRDIHQRQLAQRLAELRNDMGEAAPQMDANTLMQTALDAAEDLTASQIGFFHFVHPDQETLSLQVWSTRTLRELCFAQGEGLHYPVSQAGVWVDCVHQRAPVIHNDYAALEHKKGMPEGHAPVTRLATVPVFREGAITAVMGVGNKATDYTHQDVEALSRVADMAFDFVERRRAQQEVEFRAYHDPSQGCPTGSCCSTASTRPWPRVGARGTCWRCATWTWTTSSRSTTPRATTWGMPCWWRRPGAWPRSCARGTPWPASGGTSSSCCSRSWPTRSRARPSSAASWPGCASRSGSRAGRSGSRAAWASPSSPPTTATPTAWCATPTRPCTRPRPWTPGATASTTWSRTRPNGRAGTPSRRWTGPWPRASSCSTTSPGWTCAAAGWWGWRPCCAGSTRSAACARPGSSCTCWRARARRLPWGPGWCAPPWTSTPAGASRAWSCP